MCGDFEKFQKISVCGFCTVVCGDFEKFQKAPVVCGDFENFRSSPVCGHCAVMCGDFKNFHFPCVGLCAVWCVGTLKILKVPWCVGSMLWCVKTLRFFLKSPLCVAPLLWCVLTLRFFKEPLCGSVLWCMWTKIKDSKSKD